METKGIDLTKCKGLNFKANICGTPSEGRIQVEKGVVYLCQDKRNGADCQDKLGFRYSWGIRKGSPEDMKAVTINVTDFEIVPRDPETYSDWQAGDVIRNTHESSDNGKVIFSNGEFVAVEIIGMCRCYTCQELFNDGYRLVLTNIEKQIIEERKEAEWKPQDGDICFVMDRKGNNDVFIFKDGWYRTTYYASCSYPDEEGTVMLDDAIDVLRPATEEEKQRLFASMTKEGKRWNAEKKCVENIPKSHEFRKGEPVLVRSDRTHCWQLRAISLSVYGNPPKVEVTDGCDKWIYWIDKDEVIPYNERTMHLLGKTEDYREE